MNNVAPSRRFEDLGFKIHPFQPLAAEKMTVEFLEQTFVAHPGFNEHIMNLENSAVLLAPPGGGKTTGRLHLETALQERQKSFFLYDSKIGSPPYAPLVVSYTDFQQLADNLPTKSERLAGKFPDVRLKHHTEPLMSAFAEALATFVISYPDRFQRSSEKNRERNGSFLLTHLRNEELFEKLSEKLPEHNWLQATTSLPIPSDDSIEGLFKNLGHALKSLGLDRVVILVDNVDGYNETQSQDHQAALVLPLLNAHSLLSLEFVTWKFFLPSGIELLVSESSGRKTGRLDLVSIRWDEESLKALLNERVKVASYVPDERRGISSIYAVATDELKSNLDIEAQLFQMALGHPELGPPRALLELANDLFQARRSNDGAQELTMDDWREFKQQRGSQGEDSDDSIKHPDLLTIADTSSRQGKAVDNFIKHPLNTRGKPIDFKGKIDFGIITIKREELLAVLKRFSPDTVVEDKRSYMISRIPIAGADYQAAIVQCPAQGTNVAQSVTHDLIEELDPRWILLTGIAGGKPSEDFTLGDVVIADQIHDFTIEAANEGGKSQYGARERELSRTVQNRVTELPYWAKYFAGWNNQESIDQSQPLMNLESLDVYGDDDWQDNLKKKLQRHFKQSSSPRLPLYITGAIASSDRLIKDTEIIKAWGSVVRQIIAFEMEAVGVYEAADKGDHKYPVITIRGISDIAGLKRDPAWTDYACNSAAAFAYALVKSGIFGPAISQNPR
jgi:nucleoside phosphorylase